MTESEKVIQIGKAIQEGLEAGIEAGMKDKKGNRVLRQTLRRVEDQGSKWYALMKELAAEDRVNNEVKP